MVDRPEEVESFVLLEDEESFEVFDEFENLDLRLFDGDGGGMWRGKGEPGQSITFTFTFPKKTFTFSNSLSTPWAKQHQDIQRMTKTKP